MPRPLKSRDNGSRVTREEALAYLTANILINEETGCHEWQGPRTSDGYGQVGPNVIYFSFGIKGAHRLSYALHHNHSFNSRHEQVLHSCDNPRCIAPAHLATGTAQDNMQDALRKRRLRCGEDHPKATITVDTVRAIRKMKEEGWRYTTIAKHFGVSYNLVSAVGGGRSWKSVH